MSKLGELFEASVAHGPVRNIVPSLWYWRDGSKLSANTQNGCPGTEAMKKFEMC